MLSMLSMRVRVTVCVRVVVPIVCVVMFVFVCSPSLLLSLIVFELLQHV